MTAARPDVLLVGSPHWCRHLKEVLERHGGVRCHTSGDALRWLFAPARSICLVGVGAPDTAKRRVYHVAAFLLHRLRIVRSRVLYWIGSDVIRLRPGDRLVSGCRNIAGSEWIAGEVRSKGYACIPRLFPVELRSGSAVPFPVTGRLRVLAYIPDAQHELHGSSELLQLATGFPNVEFSVIGGAGTWCRDRPGNLQFVGWVSDIAVPIRESHVLLRRTQHDSFSAFVREGIAAGRHVLFTYDVPGVTWVRSGDMEALMAAMRALQDRFRRGELVPTQPPAGILALITDVRSQARALADELG